MTDNGSAMLAGEFTEGLSRLSILHCWRALKIDQFLGVVRVEN